MAEETNEHPFAELPAVLIDEMLQSTRILSQKLLEDFNEVRANRDRWRTELSNANLLHRDSDLPYMPIPTTCGIDGSYAIERLLASDLVAVAALAVEGLTPPSEARYWPEPRHLLWIQTETHEAETSTILRALMIGMELELAAKAPHEIVFLDGSLTTPIIYFNQAMNKMQETLHLQSSVYLLHQTESFLEAYSKVLSSQRIDRCWIAIPKYTTRRELGQALNWPANHDDRGLLSLLLEAGEFTRPLALQQPYQPWHLNLDPISTKAKKHDESLRKKIIDALKDIFVVYYRPYPWLPALRLEMNRAITESEARLASVIHGIRHQCGTPAVMEPYPLYMADRMVKHLSRAIPTLRQVTSQYMTEIYQGNINEIFLGLHGYRTETGV